MIFVAHSFDKRKLDKAIEIVKANPKCQSAFEYVYIKYISDKIRQVVEGQYREGFMCVLKKIGSVLKETIIEINLSTFVSEILGIKFKIDHEIKMVMNELDAFRALIGILKEVNLKKTLRNDIISSFLTCADELYSGEYSYLDYKGVMEDKLYPLLDIAFYENSDIEDDDSLLLVQIYGVKKVNDLFDIIVDYPDSIDEHILNNYKQIIVESLQKDIRKRLLHIGASTEDILTHFVNTLRSMKYFDKFGVLGQIVTEPIRDYLKHRSDGINKLIFILLSGDLDDLFEEYKQCYMNSIGEYETETSFNDLMWKPNPRDLNDLLSENIKIKDNLSIAMEICDSSDVFANEYQNLLAQRILNAKSFDCEKEIHHLELLKLKFGENSLQMCQVMIKDVMESKRMILENSLIQVLVISNLFWPKLKNENFNLPQKIQAELSRFNSSFESVKAARRLEWLHDVGLVNVELSFEDGRVINFEVSPFHASLISLFESEDCITFDDIAIKLNVSTDLVISRGNYWVHKNVLKKTDDSFILIETLNDTNENNLYFDDDSHQNIHVSEESKPGSEMINYWPYIEGMLTNLGSLPIDRIHLMLGMFVQGPSKYSASIEALEGFLNSLVIKEKLDYSNGLYSLKK
ncbi:APC2-like protein [Rozella allomycis CSF55]|uniref:Anaphase-promoting complex subunit 2 n=1 Tax=Rozella allomycis (strain CSF55) TaxID=988480 RepID=A0A075B4I1_ROZAC|nr:APC2-like protein [Rozella allomycis CSF55]|eukprot:EPZ36177.1 APC2-like protein [Rozella allomycis CSF55]